MKVLVTGSLGFIGSHLVEKLINLGHEVIGVDDLSGGNWENKKGNRTYIADCRNKSEIDTIFAKHRPEVVYQLASNAAEGKSHFCPIDITSRNYSSFLNVLVAGINNGMKRIVITSSVAVYGSIKPPFKETDVPEPEDLYGLSKLEMEKTLKILSKVHNFEYNVARPHNVYGPGQSMRDPYRNVVMLWMNKLLHNEPYVIYGDGSMSRCYTYIGDLIEGLYKLGFENINKEIFNIGADESVSLKELSDAIQEVSGYSIPPVFLPTRPQETSLAVPDHTKSKEMLGYVTSTSLLEGIRNTWMWANKYGPQEQQYTTYEINSPKMPTNWK